METAVCDFVLQRESALYSNIGVAEKYDILEVIRIALDDLYNNDISAYNHCKQNLRASTWSALEDAWTLWNPVPKNNGEWGGDNNMTFILSPSHKCYIDCLKRKFIQCTYDKHGSPDFSSVTYVGSVVDISDIYDGLSVDQIHKRGGGSESLQEIAQERMSKSLSREVIQWANKNNTQYDPYLSFYQWRDANNLVPHEDTNCRTMRLVYRPAHEAFKHRGGVANAINIKKHFE